MLKAFPNQPPFGPEWFGVMRDADHPLTVFRQNWMLLNIQEDERIEAETRQQEIEYGGFFANPDVYRAVDRHRKGLPIDEDEDDTPKEQNANAVQDPFRIVVDTSPFTERLQKAAAGEVVINPQRHDVAAWLKHKREEKAREIVSDRRIHTAPVSPVQDEHLDTIIVERYPPDDTDG